MEQYLQLLMGYLRHHPAQGILFTFLIALIESLPLLGTLFPGSVTMTAVGALIGASVLPPVLTCISAILGAFMGDCFGFWLGHRYHATIRLVWPLNKLGKYLAMSEKYFRKHGGKSIIIGRFIGPTRAAMPLLAGILRYNWGQFLPAAIFAAIVWSLVYMAPGIALGALAMEFSHADMTKVFFSGLAVIVALWLGFWLLQFFFKQLSRAINRQIQTLWNWLSQPEAGFWVRLIRNQQHPHDFHQLKLTLLLLLSSTAFLLLFVNVSQQGFMTEVNEPIFYLMQSFRTPITDRLATIFTIIGTPEILLMISLLCALGLVVYKQWRMGIHLALLAFITAAATEAIKKFYFSPRPEGFWLVDHGSSFPSGHVAMSVAVFGFLAFITAKTLPRRMRQITYGFIIFLIVLISFSRIFLGQHWFTDILGAWLLGCSTLLLATISYRRMPKPQSILKIQKKQWFGILAITTLLPWFITGLLNYQSTLQETQTVWPKTLLNWSQWWAQPTKSVPLYRQDRFGRIAQPFNVQWAGNLDDIQAFLLQRGWIVVAARSRMDLTRQRFTSLRPEDNIPLLPWLYRNKPPEIFFIRHVENSPDILELRLWQSGIQFENPTLPLWLGIVTYHTPPEKILRFPHRYIRLQSGYILVDMSPDFNGMEFQLVHITSAQQPERIRALHWDGDVFVLKPHYEVIENNNGQS